MTPHRLVALLAAVVLAVFTGTAFGGNGNDNGAGHGNSANAPAPKRVVVGKEKVVRFM